LKTVIDGSVDDVDAALDGGDDGLGVGGIGAFIWLTEIGADAQRRKNQALHCAKVSVGCATAKTVGVAVGACCGCFLGHLLGVLSFDFCKIGGSITDLVWSRLQAAHRLWLHGTFRRVAAVEFISAAIMEVNQSHELS
jgi:hypothetical protein